MKLSYYLVVESVAFCSSLWDHVPLVKYAPPWLLSKAGSQGGLPTSALCVCVPM